MWHCTIYLLDDHCKVVAGKTQVPFDQFDASFDAEEDVVILRRVKRKANWLEVWKKCPVPMDDLPPRSRELPKKLKL